MSNRSKQEEITEFGWELLRGGMSRRDLLRKGAALGAVPPMAMFLNACGGGSSGGGGGSAADSLIILETDIANGLDADGASQAQSATQTAYAQLYDPLVGWKRKQNGAVLEPVFGEFEPRLAESWEQDGLTWTFKLREGVKSAAGNELTSEDVLWTFNRAKSVNGPVVLGWFLLNVAGVLDDSVFDEGLSLEDKKITDELEIVDDYTFKINQKVPSPLLLTVLPVLSLGVIDSKEAEKHTTPDDPWGHKWLDTGGAAGFGAYSVANWTKGESLTLQANPDYYRGEPQFKTLVFRRVPQSGSRATAIQRQEAGAVTAMSPKEYNELDADPNVDSLAWEGNVFIALGPNYKFEPWAAGGDFEKSTLLRQAVAHAIPYEEIIEDGFFGRAKQWNGLISSSFYGAVSFEGRYGYDPDKARQLLAEAGYPNGEGLQGPGLTLTYIAEHASWIDPIANRIRTALAEIGIDISLDPIPTAQFVDREANKDDIPLSLLDQQVAIGTDAGYQSQLNFVSAEAGGLDNSTNYVSKEFDRLYEKQRVDLNSERRLRTLEQMQEILIEDLPRIPVVEFNTQIAVTAGTTDWAPRPDTAIAGELWHLKTAES